LASSRASRISRHPVRSERSIRSAARIALIALAIACCGAARAQDTSAQSQPEAAPSKPEHAGYRLQIEAPDAVRGMLEKGLGLVRWQDYAGMTEPLLRRLVAEAVPEIRSALNARGWFSPKIDTSVERAQTGWVVRIKVDPGEATRVSKVELSFGGPVTEAGAEGKARMDAVRRAWTLPEGSRFTQSGWEAAKQSALAALAAERYAAASIAESEAYIDPEERKAVLNVTFASGPPFHIGPVEVSGTRRIPASVVRNFNPLEPGELWSRQRVSLYERRLVQSGYFVAA
jgi:translocation and assembly module TamA